MKIIYKCHNPNLWNKGNNCNEINEFEFDTKEQTLNLSNRRYHTVGFMFKHKCKKCGFQHNFEIGASEDFETF